MSICIVHYLKKEVVLMSGGCECDCARCDIGAHCGKKKRGCRFFEEDAEEDGDDDEEEEDDEDDD